MKIKFIKEIKWTEDETFKKDDTTNTSEHNAKWAIDNGYAVEFKEGLFAEPKKELKKEPEVKKVEVEQNKMFTPKENKNRKRK